MADFWQLDERPNGQYLTWISEAGRAFADPDWVPILRTLGADPVFAWHKVDRFGTLVARFRRGPFKVGVCGMPVSGEDWDSMDHAQAFQASHELCVAAGLDVLRVNRSMQDRPDPKATAVRPEAWIEDLAIWDAGDVKRLRKDLALAHRAGGGGNRVVQGFDPAVAQTLYADTVLRHGGAVRYPPSYFSALADLAPRSKNLRIFSVSSEKGDMLGFSVLAMHSGVAHYLHGAVNDIGKREGVSDLLLEAMLVAARDAGARSMTFMGSPWEQPGLIAFKEKWSNRRGFAVTHDVAGSLAGWAACQWLRWKFRSNFAHAQSMTSWMQPT